MKMLRLFTMKCRMPATLDGEIRWSMLRNESKREKRELRFRRPKNRRDARGIERDAGLSWISDEIVRDCENSVVLGFG